MCVCVCVSQATHQSKGSAFVWYVSRAHAERAILQFNLRHVLPDHTGEQDRPLVVRKARVRAGKPGLPLMAGLPGGPMQGGLGALGGGATPLGHPAVTVVTGGSGMQPVLNLQGGQTYYAGGSKMMQGSSGLGGLDQITLQQGGASYVAQGAYQTVQQIPGAQLVSVQAAPTVSESGLYEAYGQGTYPYFNILHSPLATRCSTSTTLPPCMRPCNLHALDSCMPVVVAGNDLAWVSLLLLCGCRYAGRARGAIHDSNHTGGVWAD